MLWPAIFSIMTNPLAGKIGINVHGGTVTTKIIVNNAIFYTEVP